MNCKPGDLAVIVSGIPAGNIGKIIRVLELAAEPAFFGVNAWRYEGSGVDGMQGGEATYIEDSCLRPIRDPGDDVADESAAWLPLVPVDDEVPA